MIQIKTKGGLGNMLFQIAAGYVLACKLGVDWAVIRPITNIHGDMYSKYKNNILDKVPFIDTWYNFPIYEEPSFSYNNLPLSKNITLDGYFQSEKYFFNYRALILNLFTQQCSDFDEAKTQYETYNSSPTVSLHVRRGDYLNHPNTHPQLSLNYYNNAMDKFPGHNVLVFSDDINWCKHHLNRSNTHFIENNTDVIDLYLMSLCNNNIITNSTFSWWGAWLNQNKNKKIIAPHKWFGPAVNHNTKNLIPESWNKI